MIAGENHLFTTVRLKGDDVEGQWLRERDKGIGGSDVAALLGMSQWKSPITLWCEKTGRIEPQDLSGVPYVEFGNLMEPFVAKWYSEKYPDRTVRSVKAILRSIQRPWALASLDREVKDPELGWGVLEIKTARTKWEDGVPDHYLTQVIHYLSVTGRKFADVAVFYRDSCKYEDFRIIPDEEDMEYVVSGVDTFWNDHVEKDVMPPTITGQTDESKAIYQLYKYADEEMSPEDADRAEELCTQIMDLNDRIKPLSEDKSKAANELKLLINEHKGLITFGHVATWVRSEKRDSGVRVKERKQ